MTPFEARCKARKIRGLCQVGDRPHTMSEAADIQHVSRSTAYRILQELIDWEAIATFAEEIADIDKQLREMPSTGGRGWYELAEAHDAARFHLASGKLTMAYMRNELPPELDKQRPADDLMT